MIRACALYSPSLYAAELNPEDQIILEDEYVAKDIKHRNVAIVSCFVTRKYSALTPQMKFIATAYHMVSLSAECARSFRARKIFA